MCTNPHASIRVDNKCLIAQPCALRLRAQPRTAQQALTLGMTQCAMTCMHDLAWPTQHDTACDDLCAQS
jgi:hypothetical protein